MKIGIQLLFCSCLMVFASAIGWAQKPELVVQTGHSEYVASVTFSVDGKTLVSGGGDNKIKLWDVATGREKRALIEHSGTVASVACSANGKILASGSTDSTIKLWDMATGRVLRTLIGHKGGVTVTSVAFSPDGRTLATGAGDSTIKFWDVATGRELRTLTGHTSTVDSVAFSADGKMLASGGDKTIKLWEVSTGRELRTLPGLDYVQSVAFSVDGKTVASGGADKTIRLWEVDTGRELRTLIGHSTGIRSVVFSPDGKTLASAGNWDSIIKLWEVTTGRELRTITGHSDEVTSIAFSADGKKLASGSKHGVIKLWEVATGSELRTLTGHAFRVYSVAISPNGRTLASCADDKTIKLWDMTTGQQLHTLAGHSEPVISIAFSADSQTLASGSRDKTIKLWDISTGRELRTLAGHPDFINFVAWSSDGKTLSSSSQDLPTPDGTPAQTIKIWNVTTEIELRTFQYSGGTTLAFSQDAKTVVSGSRGTLVSIIRALNQSQQLPSKITLWDAATGRELRTLSGHPDMISSAAFTADGTILATGSYDQTIKLWDVRTARELHTLTGHSSLVNSLAFSRDGKTLASGSPDQTIRLWEVATGRELHTLSGHSNSVTSVAFSPGGEFLVSGSDDATCKLWRVKGGELLASLIALDDRDWAVVSPNGRFDASSNAQQLMNWLVGNEHIELEQLKERYYEPRLLAKLTGFNKEPLRDVSTLMDVKLFPTVDYQLGGPKSTSLDIKLINRGGGIGPVQVFVNDKELIADARPPGFNPDQAQAILTVDLSSAPTIPGQVNEIRVVARNHEGYLASRGTKLVWTPAGPSGATPPDLYAIVVGTSTYTSPALDLRYAAKDAGDMARALELGAKRLFGAERVHLQLLSTDKSNPRAIAPTKSNISKAFEQVTKARPQDIFVIYFAGHGVTLQQGKDSYLYLAQEARTTDSAALADPVVRAQTTISSEELVEWIKRVPALKQVMILDTCAAGAAAGKLVEQRNVSGDQIRAIERLKDRTGFHVLMGSAADAVSYEASQYGQGVLTYALLQGMRGAALREEEYVDVQKLFQYAADEVPQLARNIGGLQRPLVSAPRGTSFDVGRIGRDEKALIPVATIKPVILRPVLLNAEEQADTLELIGELRKRLREESYVSVRAGGREPLVVYVDEDELPGAIRPSGTYTVAGNRVRVTMILRRDGQRIATLPVIEGAKNDVPGLIDKIMQAISAAISGPLR